MPRRARQKSSMARNTFPKFTGMAVHTQTANSDSPSRTKPTYRFGGELSAALMPLRDRPWWVAWGYRWRDGRWTKPPINPRTGCLASINDPTTWATFDVAVASMERYSLAGVGLVLTEDAGI